MLSHPYWTEQTRTTSLPLGRAKAVMPKFSAHGRTDVYKRQGWAYADWLTVLGRNPSMDTVSLGARIVDGFVAGAGAYDATTLSVIDLRYIPAAYLQMCAFLSDAQGQIVDGAYKTFSVARADAKAYGEGEFEQIDIQDYMMRTGLPAAQEVCTLVQQAVCYYGGSVADSYGLAMYFPYKALGWYNNMHDTPVSYTHLA